MATVRTAVTTMISRVLMGGSPFPGRLSFGCLGYGSNNAAADILPPVAEMTTYIDFLPIPCQGGPMPGIHKVVAVVQEGVEPFGLGSICEVWGEPPHPEDDGPTFEFVVCTEVPGRVRGATGYDLHVEHGLDQLEDADLVCIVPKREFLEQSPAVVDAVRRAADRGAMIFAHCTGAFLLGEAGLLDGRRGTTHWRYASGLARRFGNAVVAPDVLSADAGNTPPGAGPAAGPDAALPLIRREFGPRVAATTARRMVVPPQRAGGQAQFVRSVAPADEAETLGPLLGWI